MKLRKILIATTLPALVGGGVVCKAESENLNEAAATVMGHSLRQAFRSLTDAGLELNEVEFMDGVVNVFFGDTIGGFTPQSADAAIRRATAPQRPDSFMANADEENAWVKKQLELPRTRELPGGVVLQSLVEGSGNQVPRGATVRVMYTGRLSNGMEFDSTTEPFELPLDAIVPGLAQAIEQMREGGTYRVFIPPVLAYGHEAIMDLIPGDSALDFTISDITIVKK